MGGWMARFDLTDFEWSVIAPLLPNKVRGVSKAYDGDIQMIDSSSIRVHQHAANGQKKRRDPVAWVVRGAG